MAAKALNYPHPVLSVDTNDFPGCSFSFEITDFDDSSKELVIGCAVNLDCEGLRSMISSGEACVCIRLRCGRTSFRRIFRQAGVAPLEIRVDKALIADSLEIQAFVVAACAKAGYALPEFNATYFGSMAFNLRKGDILALEPGVTIKLDTVLEKDMAGIVLIKEDKNASSMRIHYAAIEDEQPDWSDYIYVVLPTDEYLTVGKLKTKKYLKHGIERFIQATIVLPAITEAITLLRIEAESEPDSLDRHYRDTVWGQSLAAALIANGIDDVADETRSSFELADQVLGCIASDSFGNLMQKMIDWSSVGEEDEDL